MNCHHIHLTLGSIDFNFVRLGLILTAENVAWRSEIFVRRKTTATDHFECAEEGLFPDDVKALENG